jgi:transglutaminase-like putative cysteine protease
MIYRIQHSTTYRYAKPVVLGRHRLMFRPRDSHDLRLLDTSLEITPPAQNVRWLHDVFGNSVTLVDFDQPAEELRFFSEMRLEQFAAKPPPFAIEDFARTYPFSYAAEDLPDLGRTRDRHYADPEHRVDEWAKQFAVSPDGGLPETLPLLERMTLAIKTSLTYQPRYSEGTQSPEETLRRGSGTCRDYSLLMMEAARSLGFAARFVSGYVHDPADDGGSASGSTHAWLQIYLPGAGWTEFDPTNGIIGNRGLIRVAVTSDPSQAVPVSGQWTGEPADFLGMEVDVRVSVDEDANP